MHGLMMDYPLTLSTIFRRAEQLYGRREIVSRRPDKSIHRYTYRDWAGRTRRPLARFSISASGPATASRPSAGTTGRISRRTSGSRWSAPCCIR
jgi:hypothetical protein